MLVSQISPINNYNKFQKTNVKKANIAFCATPVVLLEQPKSNFFKFARDAFKPIGKLYGQLTTGLARILGKSIDNDYAIGLFDKTKNNDMFTHLMVLGSTIMSGFYIKKTLDSDKLDPKKKKTLAVNQAVVWGVSTVMAYTFEKMINKKFKAFVDEFKSVFTKRYGTMQDEMINLPKYESGLRLVRSAIIVGTVYRYIAPVLVTPIANAIGNKVNEKKSAHK